MTWDQLPGATALLGVESPRHLLGWSALRLDSRSRVPLGVKPLVHGASVGAAEDFLAIGSLERGFLERRPTVLVLIGARVVGLEMYLVALGHVIEKHLVLVKAISGDMGPIVLLVERLVACYLLECSIVHLWMIKFILLLKVILGFYNLSVRRI
jgi:hypothetical protein